MKGLSRRGRWNAGLLGAAGRLRSTAATLGRYPMAMIATLTILLFMAVALFAPAIAPYGPFEVAYTANQAVVRLASPSGAHWLGTTNLGMDVLSQLVWGTRITLAVGVTAALVSVLIGTLIGVVAGYFGGWTESILMSVTDVAFAIPFLPFAMVIISMSSPSVALIIALVSLFLWQTTARVIRAQVLSMRTRPFIWAARAAGVGHLRIITRHIVPNVLPLSFLYIAVGVQSGVMLEAALSFLGFGDPYVQSWGVMLNAAFHAGAMRTAWWWVLPPGIALAVFVLAVFSVGRAYEEILNPRLRAL